MVFKEKGDEKASELSCQIRQFLEKQKLDKKLKHEEERRRKQTLFKIREDRKKTAKAAKSKSLKQTCLTKKLSFANTKRKDTVEPRTSHFEDESCIDDFGCESAFANKIFNNLIHKYEISESKEVSAKIKNYDLPLLLDKGRNITNSKNTFSESVSDMVTNRDAERHGKTKALLEFDLMKDEIISEIEKYVIKTMKNESYKIYKLCEAAMKKEFADKISEMQENQDIQRNAIEALVKRVSYLEKNSILSNTSSIKELEAKTESSIKLDGNLTIKMEPKSIVKSEEIKFESDSCFSWNTQGHEENILNG